MLKSRICFLERNVDMRKLVVLGLGLAFAGLGCVEPPPPPASAVLAGEWVSTNLDDLQLRLTFDDDGILTKVEATRVSDGATAELNPQNATSEVDSNAVTITVPTSGGSAVYEATLADDEDSMSGALSAVIDLENGAITVPQGALDLVRDDGSDPCLGVVCTNGLTCVDGECVPEDPCAGVNCDEGETCVNGECVPDDPCAGVNCDEGETCVDGECVPENGGGDPVAGETFYGTSCVACHGAGGAGGIGPNIQGQTAAELQAGVEGAAIHASLTISAEDYANLAAYLAAQGG